MIDGKQGRRQELPVASLIDCIALSLVPGLGVTSYWRLLDHFGTPERILAAREGELRRVAGLGRRHFAGLLSGCDYRLQAHEELLRLGKMGGFAISSDDDDYPALLRHLPDPPPVLYGLGRRELLGTPAVAVVGSRAATGYGRKVAFVMGEQLARGSLTVVSGLALGIDAQAHAGALRAGGDTVAVLGCGLDIVYPQLNRALFETLRIRGLLLSEYPLGTKPEGFRFPARNRLIAAMCQGVVVVEAARRSGSLITAQIALDLGREVFAVPGPIDSHKSEGTHWLLKQGASLARDVDDIIAELRGFGTLKVARADSRPAPAEPSLDPEATRLLGLLDTSGEDRETLLSVSGLSPARCNELLLVLELEGLVELLPGDRVCRVAGSLADGQRHSGKG